MSINNKEQTALLKLTEHFSDTWNVFDVGSNKGMWSDILINHRDSSVDAYKYSVTMFEPNDLLLNYTRVKYDYNKNVVFVNYAVSDNVGNADFFYFTNENSGLSSLLNNPKWDYLPKQKKKVRTLTLDSYCSLHGIGDIDIVKIDVEGNEFAVLKGCKRILSDKTVKIFQVEYSEHYKLSGHTFSELIEYMASFGYSCWDFDGEYFVKVTDFTEDYRLDNLYFTYLEIGRYYYTQDWSRAFIENTENLPLFNFALEIGCFEGRTTNYICDRMLMPDGRIICVDPLEDYYLKEGSDLKTNQLFIGQYERFIRNTIGKPVELIRKESKEAYPLLKDYLFDFIYIDGSHLAKDVCFDGHECFKLLKRGGYILFDDYTWQDCGKGIDIFLQDCEKELKVLIKNEQVLIQKI